jgi:CubicO group peptidase (beta-lactamase class C family)
MFTLDAPIEDALGFRVRNPSFPAVKITYKHLYTHTSGLQDDYKGYLYDSKCPKSSPYPKSLTETMEPYVAKKANWGKKAPGSKYDYSNMGSTLAALLVEKISGQPFDTFTERHIFQRLGMASTSWARPTASADVYELRGTKYHTRSGGYCFPDWPSGQLHSSASDMAKFASSMLAGGRLWEGTGSTPKVGCLYSAATAVRAFKPQSPQTGDGDSALGWFVGKPYYPGGAGHDGSEFGVSSDLYIMTDSGVAIGWMANGALSDKEFETITAKFVSAAQAIGATKGLPPPAPGCVSKIMGEHPSLSTVAPTTSGPTTKKPAPCNDDPSWVRRRKHQTCVWIAKRASKRCRLKGKGKVTAKIGCPVTCGTC